MLDLKAFNKIRLSNIIWCINSNMQIGTAQRPRHEKKKKKTRGQIEIKLNFRKVLK